MSGCRPSYFLDVRLSAAEMYKHHFKTEPFHRTSTFLMSAILSIFCELLCKIDKLVYLFTY